MEAPDKIYVNYKGFGVFDEPATIKMQASQIEYVLKDAFIEKASKWLLNNLKCYSTNPLGAGYLIEDFKEHMKGE